MKIVLILTLIGFGGSAIQLVAALREGAKRVPTGRRQPAGECHNTLGRLLILNGGVK